MQKFFNQVIDAVLDFRERYLDYFEPALPWIKTISFLFSALLLSLIFYCIFKTGYLNRKVENFMDWAGMGNVGRRRHLRAWHKIVKRLRLTDPAEWKLAVLEADKILDEAVKDSGYRGDTVDARLKQVDASVLPSVAKVLAAHEVSNKIYSDLEFQINRETIIETLKVYKQAFRELSLLD